VHSSTSNSEQTAHGAQPGEHTSSSAQSKSQSRPLPLLNDPRARVAMGMLVVAVTCYFGGLEILARKAYPSHSAIAARIFADIDSTLGLRQTATTGRRTVLVVGNSLLLNGVDREQLLRSAVGGEISIRLLPIENTAYLDWYFGLRRLFAEGSRPDAVAICLTPRQLVSRGTDGEFFAHNLMKASDLLLVRQAAGLDLTATSTYLLAHYSAWMASRAGIRNWIRSQTITGMDELAPYFPERAGPMPPANVVQDVAMHRLSDLSGLCSMVGCRVLLIIPPVASNSAYDFLESVIEQAAVDSKVSFLMPIAPGALPADMFADGFHLNPRGAAVFTPALARSLSTAVASDLP